MKFRYIYGPVASWRLGRSLGVDLISTDGKVCSFDCIYCQIGPTRVHTLERKIFVPTDEVIEEIKRIPEVKIDYITFSGMGEPTLAKNLGEVIRRVKELRDEPVAVLTNSSLISDSHVREELSAADKVIAKLDAATQDTFEKVCRPASRIRISSLVNGLCEFRRMFKGTLALQMMFIQENIHEAEAMAGLASLIEPDEVELNTPLRPCNVPPLSSQQLKDVEKFFAAFNIRNVYDSVDFDVTPIEDDKTRRRRLGKLLSNA